MHRRSVDQGAQDYAGKPATWTTTSTTAESTVATTAPTVMTEDLAVSPAASGDNGDDVNDS